MWTIKYHIYFSYLKTPSMLCIIGNGRCQDLIKKYENYFDKAFTQSNINSIKTNFSGCTKTTNEELLCKPNTKKVVQKHRIF
jgi:hypothetical protein